MSIFVLSTSKRTQIINNKIKFYIKFDLIGQIMFWADFLQNQDKDIVIFYLVVMPKSDINIFFVISMKLRF